MSFPVCYGFIPARYASSRLPGKPLADIGGKPMFWHVWKRASQCTALRGVWLATDDERVLQAAAALEVPCIMTSASHPSGTDRVREAADILNGILADSLGIAPDDVVVNIQGDEPLLQPEMLDSLLSAFHDPAVCAATLSTPLDAVRDAALVASPHQVKVVVDKRGDALYFSRAPIPFSRDGEQSGLYAGHVGVYAFRRDTLERVTSLAPTPLELLEKLEQLRLLEHRIPLRVISTPHRPHGVDTQEDLDAVRAILTHGE